MEIKYDDDDDNDDDDDDDNAMVTFRAFSEMLQ